MGYQVTVTARDGNVTYAVFPSRKAAECYAKGLDATVSEVPGMTVVPTVARLSVQEYSAVAVKCPPATAEMQAEATSEYFRSLRSESVGRALKRSQRRDAEQRALDAENAAERRAEFFAESRLMGMSLEDTFADLDFVQARRRRQRRR